LQLNSRGRQGWTDEARRRKFCVTPFSLSRRQRVQRLIEHPTVLPTFQEEGFSSAIAPEEVTKIALRLRYLIEETVPCELEESLITRAHSRIITPEVVQVAKEAGESEHGACVVYCLLINKRWFRKQASIELWDADLHNIRAIACEVIAKAL
jgi:hypothetical protein